LLKFRFDEIQQLLYGNKIRNVIRITGIFFAKKLPNYQNPNSGLPFSFRQDERKDETDFGFYIFQVTFGKTLKNHHTDHNNKLECFN
jgi:hypothetical protein